MKKHQKFKKKSQERVPDRSENIKNDFSVNSKSETSSILYYSSSKGEHQRARTPTNTGTLKNIGKFPSLKNRTTVWFESLLERDFIHLIEFDRDVLEYFEQPFKVKYQFNGKSRVYTPDFLVHRQSTKQIIEVKPQAKTEQEEFIAFSKYMENFLASKGFEYVIATESLIRPPSKLFNIKLFWRYAKIPITMAHRVLIDDLFSKSSAIAFSDVCSYLCQLNERKEVIYSLLFHGYLTVAIQEPLTAESLVFKGNLS